MNYFSYFSEIEEAFVRRRGKNLLLSPLDWALIEGWKERGVPLAIVLRAIDYVFENADRNPARKRAIKSLVYCRDEVENQFAAWQETQIGIAESAERKAPNAKSADSAAFPSAVITAHLTKVIDELSRPRIELNGSWENFSGDVLNELNAARQRYLIDGNAEILENELNQIDGKVDESLPKIYAPEAFAKVKNETAAQLRSHKSRMNPAAFAETYKVLLIKNLRTSAELPRFSLYYL